MDFFFRKKPWYAGQFVRKIVPKIYIPDGAIPFFSTVFNLQKHKLLAVLVRDVDSVFMNCSVNLPVENGQINFSFMGKFIAELEARHIAELEAYLLASGLSNYNLIKEESDAVENIKAVKWQKYRIGELFEKISTKKLPYKANDLPKNPTGKYVLPCLTSSFQNQGLNYYVPKEGATVLNGVISIPSNSDVYRAYYQSRAFTVLSDAYAIRWKDKDVQLSKNQYLFMVQCINKVTDLKIYSYKNKLGGWNVVKNRYILLPEKDGKIDFGFMELFISAVQKLSIKDVVLFAERKEAITKSIVAN